MSADLYDSELSYSRRVCRKCQSALLPRRGLLGRTTWRCEQCRSSVRVLSRR